MTPTASPSQPALNSINLRSRCTHRAAKKCWLGHVCSINLMNHRNYPPTSHRLLQYAPTILDCQILGTAAISMPSLLHSTSADSSQATSFTVSQMIWHYSICAVSWYTCTIGRGSKLWLWWLAWRKPFQRNSAHLPCSRTPWNSEGSCSIRSPAAV